MKLNFPGAAPAAYSGAFFSQFFSRLTLAFTTVVSSQQATPRIILSAPDGGLWAVTVSNTGVLSTATATPSALGGERTGPTL